MHTKDKSLKQIEKNFITECCFKYFFVTLKPKHIYAMKKDSFTYYIYSLSMAWLLAWLLLPTACNTAKDDEATEQQAVDTIPVLITQIQNCSRLYSAEYQVRKIVTHEDEKQVQGSFMQNSFSIPLPMGKRRIAIPIEAKVKAYIDFADFSEANVHRRGEKIEIVLPDPQISITSTKIARNEVREYVPLLRSDFTDEELTFYEQKGRQAIVNDIPHMGIIDMARQSAAATLIPMIQQLGFSEKNITITFRKEFTMNDLPALLDKRTIEHGKTR